MFSGVLPRIGGKGVESREVVVVVLGGEQGNGDGQAGEIVVEAALGVERHPVGAEPEIREVVAGRPPEHVVVDPVGLGERGTIDASSRPRVCRSKAARRS